MKMPLFPKESSSVSTRRQLLGWKASVNLLRASSLRLGMAALAGSSLLFAGSLRANTELDVASGLATGSDLSVGTSYTGGTAPTATSDVTFNATNTYNSTYVFNSATTIGSLNDLSATATSITGGAGTVTLAGGDSVSGNTGDLVFVGNGANLTYTQGLTLGLTGNFDVAGTGTASFTGNIGDGGNENAVNPDPVHNFSLVKTGTGTLILSKNNTFTGGTVVNAGTLVSNQGGPYSTFRGTVTVNAGGTLALNATDSFGYNSPTNATDQIIINGGTVNDLVNGNQGYLASLTMTGGTFSSTGGGAFNINTAAASAPGITTNASATTATISAGIVNRGGATSLVFTTANGTTASGDDLTVSGVIGGGGITKAGAGTMLLTATNTYTGATAVNAGRLLVGNGGSIAAGAVTVTGTGSIFGGSGAVGGTVNIGNGSTLTVRNGVGTNSAVGTLTTGALTLATGSTFNAFVANGTSFSTLSAGGTTALGGAAFTIGLGAGATFTNGQILELISSAVSGTFTNASYTTGGYTFTADYTNAPDPLAFAVDVTRAAAAPEPSTWAALVSMAGMAGFVYRRRTRA